MTKRLDVTADNDKVFLSVHSAMHDGIFKTRNIITFYCYSRVFNQINNRTDRYTNRDFDNEKLGKKQTKDQFATKSVSLMQT